jgi:hypothetical protein
MSVKDAIRDIKAKMFILALLMNSYLMTTYYTIRSSYYRFILQNVLTYYTNYLYIRDLR